MTSIERYNQELYHYGVKGMKWGVRKSEEKRLYKTLNKYARSRNRIDMLGTGVKENKTLAEAARKAKSAAEKHNRAVAKRSELENLAEYGKTQKIRNTALRKYEKALKESDNTYKEYRECTKKLAHEYLGKYADMPLKNMKQVTAGEAFCRQVEWGIGMGWVNDD